MNRIYIATLLMLCCMVSSISKAEPLPAAQDDSSLSFAAAVKEEGRWGVINGDGRTIVPIKYDTVDLSLEKGDTRLEDMDSMSGRKNLIEVSYDGKQGFYDRQGHTIVPAVYDDRSFWKDGQLAVEKDGLIGFYSVNGQQTVPPQYKKVSDFQNGMAVFKKDNLYGFINAEGKEAVPALYTSVHFFKEGLAPVKKDNKWGAVNVSGEVVVPFLFDDAGPSFTEGLLAVKQNGKWGFINTSGIAVVPIIYRQVRPVFHEGYTAVQDEHRAWGFVGLDGTVTASPRFVDVLTPFSEGLAGVLTADGKAYARPDGHIAFTADFDEIYPFHDGIAEYRKSELSSRRFHGSISYSWGWGGGWYGGWPMWGHWGYYRPWHYYPFFYDPWFWDDWGPRRDRGEVRRGYIDNTGKIIANTSIDRVYPITKDGVLVRNDDRYGWIDRTGQYIIHTAYRDVRYVPEERLLLARSEDKRWGVLSLADGSMLVPFQYDSLTSVGKGFLAYKDNGKWGVMTSAGKPLTRALYKKVGAAGDGLIPVLSENGWTYLNDSGETAFTFPSKVQDTTGFSQGRAGVKIDGKWGLIDTSGQFIVSPRYDKLELL